MQDELELFTAHDLHALLCHLVSVFSEFIVIKAIGMYKKVLFFCSEGVPYILFGLMVALALSIIAYRKPHVLFILLAIVAWLVALEIGYFFRDPERHGSQERGSVLAPADGKIIDIRSTHEKKFIKGECTRLSIFMNIFNVHVNRAPIGGRITYCHYNPGTFISAFKEKASVDNEQVSIGFSGGESGKEVNVLVNLIAGLIARRIVLWRDVGYEVMRGERISVIKFGSRADVYLPAGAEIAVRVGDYVKAGETVIARME
jgi:phosphatidylserine decarboxylase